MKDDHLHTIGGSAAKPADELSSRGSAVKPAVKRLMRARRVWKAVGTQRRSTLVAVLAVVTLSATGVASAAGTAGTWKYWQLDQDRCKDAATMDANFNGNNEDAWFDLDNDCRWDTRIWNSLGGDHFSESLTFDMDENDVPEYRMLDINQRTGFEWLYIDRNQDGVYELRRIIPGSDLDVTTRANTNNASSTILHQFRMRTGQSLLYPRVQTP
jgi:hypothetical protein